VIERKSKRKLKGFVLFFSKREGACYTIAEAAGRPVGNFGTLGSSR
jgi:hypothetical protein